MPPCGRRVVDEFWEVPAKRGTVPPHVELTGQALDRIDGGNRASGSSCNRAGRIPRAAARTDRRVGCRGAPRCECSSKRPCTSNDQGSMADPTPDPLSTRSAPALDLISRGSRLFGSLHAVDPAPEPAPFTTIGWRLVHVALCKVIYHEWAYGPRLLNFINVERPRNVASRSRCSNRVRPSSSRTCHRCPTTISIRRCSRTGGGGVARLAHLLDDDRSRFAPRRGDRRPARPLPDRRPLPGA